MGGNFANEYSGRPGELEGASAQGPLSLREGARVRASGEKAHSMLVRPT